MSLIKKEKVRHDHRISRASRRRRRPEPPLRWLGDHCCPDDQESCQRGGILDRPAHTLTGRWRSCSPNCCLNVVGVETVAVLISEAADVNAERTPAFKFHRLKTVKSKSRPATSGNCDHRCFFAAVCIELRRGSRLGVFAASWVIDLSCCCVGFQREYGSDDRNCEVPTFHAE